MRIIFYLLALLLVSCDGNTSVDLTQFTDTVYQPKYASGFTIRGVEGTKSTLVSVKNPWQGATDVELQTLLLREGETAPASVQSIKVPVERVVCLSSSYVAMLDALSQTGKIVGVSGKEFITNPLIDREEVLEVGYDSNINFETLLALRPSVVLLYGLNNENTALTGKLKELGIPYMYIGDYLEQSPLGKAEWIRVMAELTDKVGLAERLFAGIESRYTTLKNMPKAHKPRVMINAPYRDVWFMPSVDNYMVRLITDAGGEYVYPQNTGSVSKAITLEQAYVLAEGADVWLNTGWHNTLADLIKENPKFATSKLVKQGKVFNNNARQSSGGGSDFWESGVIEPDRVLEDLIKIFSDQDVLYYYKQLE